MARRREVEAGEFAWPVTFFERDPSPRSARTVMPDHALQPSPRAPADAVRLLIDARTLIEPVHRATVDELGPALRRVAGYHIGWWDAAGRPSRASGKALRPALTLACARAVAGPDAAPPSDVIAAATAVELIHDFSLLHDDVMDGDKTRRHRPSAWAAFGTTAAILTGDALVGLAMRRVPPSLTGVLADVLVDLCEGQSADVAAETTTSVDQCLTTAARKTGSLLGAACRLGALAAGGGPGVADHYRWFGLHLGVAFQLADDILGIWGDPALTGKPVHSDITARRRSLPVMAALAADSPAARRLERLYLDTSDPDAGHIAGLVVEAGGRAWAEAEADRRVHLAFGSLHRAGPHPAAVPDLHGLAQLITSRDR
jgi:geranylgeranyl diphosphate synthase, type I